MVAEGFQPLNREPLNPEPGPLFLVAKKGGLGHGVRTFFGAPIV